MMILKKKKNSKVWRYREADENYERYESAYKRAKSIEILELQMIASFCRHDLVSYKCNLTRFGALLYLRIYGLSLKSVIFSRK